MARLPSGRMVIRGSIVVGYRIALSNMLLAVFVLLAGMTARARESAPVTVPRDQPASCYSSNDMGTYVTYGSRIVFFEGVQLSEEIGAQLLGLLAGAGWKEGALLINELFGERLSHHLPNHIRTLFFAGSQAWLAWTLCRSLSRVATPLGALLQDYRKVVTPWLKSYFSGYGGSGQPLGLGARKEEKAERFYRGAVPLPINDGDLAFRLFLTIIFPDDNATPVAVEINRVPDKTARLAADLPHSHLNPWHHVLAEMASFQVDRLRISATSRGDLCVSFRDRLDYGREQHLTAAFGTPLAPVPWLLEKVRRGVSRHDIELYSSILSQESLSLVRQMLHCYRLNYGGKTAQKRESGSYALSAEGYMTAIEGGFRYWPFQMLIPAQLVEKQDHPQARILPLTGCNLSARPDCWENYLLWNDSSVFYPWPSMTLYTKYSDYTERSSWLLFSKDPYVWQLGSHFQIRVPKCVTQVLLGLLRSTGQAVVNRLVTTVHHRVWGNGQVSAAQIKPDSVPSPEDEVHDENCPTCPDGQCNYVKCNVRCFEMFEPQSMVVMCDRRHHACRECFFDWCASKGFDQCTCCGQLHRNRFNPDFFPHNEPYEEPKVPYCPLCTVANDKGDPSNYVALDFNKGNVNEFLGDECGALRHWFRWLFDDEVKLPYRPPEKEKS